MTLPPIPPRIRTGDTIRIDTRRYLVGPPGDQVRVFTEKESGAEKAFANGAIIHMMRSGRITTDAAFRALDPGVVENLQVDWGAFSDLQRISAHQKYPFVKAVDELPMPFRDKSKHVEPMIEKIMSDETNQFRRAEKPSFRLVRAWYLRWLVAGRDIRALVSNHHKKGNRDERLPEWVTEEIRAGINETYRNEIRGSKADALVRARDRIRLHADKFDLALPSLGAKDAIGKNRVSRFIDKMPIYDLTRVRYDKREADFLMKAVRKGPPCSRPLQETEVDHTRLDLIVVDEHGRVLGRPWLTAILDRFSRMILGISITFTPPSWVSVMEALRVALQPKDRWLDTVCRAVGREPQFEFAYPCFGPLERLFCDNGPEFRSASMRQTEQALNMQIVDLPRASGHLKGRLERWLRTLNQGIVHKLPGTTKSNPRERRKYKSEKHAVLTLADTNWVVAKWIVDVYHSKIHSQTGEKPLDRWIRGMAEIGQPPAPPDDLLAPLTGKIIDRKLGPSGIVYKGLIWNSDEFSALRNRLMDGDEDKYVTVRIDPLDLRKAYVLDPTRPSDRDSWIEGDLESDPAVADLTLYQYETLRQAEADAEEPMNPKEALARARASQAILDHLNNLKPTKMPPKKIARFVTDGRNASAHVRGERTAADESEDELDSHDYRTAELLSPPPDQRGPWRHRTPALEAPPEDTETSILRVDVEAINSTVEDEQALRKSEEPQKPPVEITVRRRRTN